MIPMSALHSTWVNDHTSTSVLDTVPLLEPVGNAQVLQVGTTAYRTGWNPNACLLVSSFAASRQEGQAKAKAVPSAAILDHLTK